MKLPHSNFGALIPATFCESYVTLAHSSSLTVPWTPKRWPPGANPPLTVPPIDPSSFFYSKPTMDTNSLMPLSHSLGLLNSCITSDELLCYTSLEHGSKLRKGCGNTQVKSFCPIKAWWGGALGTSPTVDNCPHPSPALGFQSRLRLTHPRHKDPQSALPYITLT